MTSHRHDILAAAGSAPPADDGRFGFDFYFGRWSIRNERLKERPVDSNDQGNTRETNWIMHMTRLSS